MSERLHALIQALATCQRDGGCLDADEWQDAVRDEADAYAVQDGVAAALGWPPSRWKSGGAGPMGPFSHSPVSPSVGTALLGIEVEVALRLARDVTPGDALGPLEGDLVDAMCIAIECVASRWRQGLSAPALLRMADFQSNAGLLLGPWQPWQRLDWAQRPWRLTLPGQPEVNRRGGHSLGDPAGVLRAWLQHVTRQGATASAGTVVTTGAWAGLHPMTGPACGDVEIDGLGAFVFATR